jgi:hypothetical protein
MLSTQSVTVTAHSSSESAVSPLDNHTKDRLMNCILTEWDLIVESLDRPSSSEVLDALSLFTGILKVGVGPHPLIDSGVVRWDGLEWWCALGASATFIPHKSYPFHQYRTIGPRHGACSSSLSVTKRQFQSDRLARILRLMGGRNRKLAARPTEDTPHPGEKSV